LTFSFLLAPLVTQSALVGGALGEPAKLTGNDLRQAVSGKTVLVATPIGAFPIHYKNNGTMTGRAPVFVASLGTESDQGHWWIAVDRLCQRWNQWLAAKRHCFKLHHIGAILNWLRDDGLSGTATISEPVAKLR
jgi:hypothetical protein